MEIISCLIKINNSPRVFNFTLGVIVSCIFTLITNQPVYGTVIAVSFGLLREVLCNLTTANPEMETFIFTTLGGLPILSIMLI
jgi:hypothetical protein